MRVSSYDPDDPTNGGGGANQAAPMGTPNASSGGYNAVATGGGCNNSCVASKTLGNQRKFTQSGQRVATISQNYNEKTMLLSSDDEYQ